MEIHLQEMRKRAGLKQAEIAERLNVKVRTYGSWERGEAMMSLDQAYNCAVLLDCSIDEIAGMPVRDPPSSATRARRSSTAATAPATGSARTASSTPPATSRA